jgi:hypothetical protein
MAVVTTSKYNTVTDCPTGNHSTLIYTRHVKLNLYRGPAQSLTVVNASNCWFCAIRVANHKSVYDAVVVARVPQNVGQDL